MLPSWVSFRKKKKRVRSAPSTNQRVTPGENRTPVRSNHSEIPPGTVTNGRSLFPGENRKSVHSDRSDLPRTITMFPRKKVPARFDDSELLPSTPRSVTTDRRSSIGEKKESLPLDKYNPCMSTRKKIPSRTDRSALATPRSADRSVHPPTIITINHSMSLGDEKLTNSPLVPSARSIMTQNNVDESQSNKDVMVVATLVQKSKPDVYPWVAGDKDSRCDFRGSDDSQSSKSNDGMVTNTLADESALCSIGSERQSTESELWSTEIGIDEIQIDHPSTGSENWSTTESEIEEAKSILSTERHEWRAEPSTENQTWRAKFRLAAFVSTVVLLAVVDMISLS